MFARMRPTVSWASPRVNLDGCVLYAPLWNRRLDVAAGGTFKTLDRFYHTATVTGATWGSQGRTFDGADDYISVPNHAAMNSTTGISIEFWWIPGTGFGEVSPFLVDKGGGSQWTIQCVPATGQIITYMSIGGVTDKYQGGSNAVVGTPVHIIFTFDQVTRRIYTNGPQTASDATAAGVIGTTASNLLIGGNTAGTRASAGVIGEVRIYNRALSASEVMNNYLATKWRFA